MSKLYLPGILNPLAQTLVDQAACRNKSLDCTDTVDEIAAQLYQRHRGETKCSVRERTWQGLPNSEKGKYRKIVKLAVEQYSG